MKSKIIPALALVLSAVLTAGTSMAQQDGTNRYAPGDDGKRVLARQNRPADSAHFVQDFQINPGEVMVVGVNHNHP